MSNRSPELVPIDEQSVAGHCRYATALHGRCMGCLCSPHQRSRDSDALRSGETVREWL